MSRCVKPRLDPKKSYLQVALNSTLEEAQKIISFLPQSDRIIVEAGTPFIKRYGEEGIRQVYAWHAAHLAGGTYVPRIREPKIKPYIVADLKTMDRAQTEVEMAARAGASAATALGLAPIETLDAFINACDENGLDAMLDMMNVDYPLAILHKLKRVPPVVIIHRGVDEEAFNKEKQIPLHEIRRIKGMYDVMISIAGGDTLREVQRSVFNDTDIVVIWKSVYTSSEKTIDLVKGFLSEIQ